MFCLKSRRSYCQVIAINQLRIWIKYDSHNIQSFPSAHASIPILPSPGVYLGDGDIGTCPPLAAKGPCNPVRRPRCRNYFSATTPLCPGRLPILGSGRLPGWPPTPTTTTVMQYPAFHSLAVVDNGRMDLNPAKKSDSGIISIIQPQLLSNLCPHPHKRSVYNDRFMLLYELCCEGQQL